MKRLFVGFIVIGLLLLSLAMAGSSNGAAGVMPAFYDDELFTINFNQLPVGVIDEMGRVSIWLGDTGNIAGWSISLDSFTTQRIDLLDQPPGFIVSIVCGVSVGVGA